MDPGGVIIAPVRVKVKVCPQVPASYACVEADNAHAKKESVVMRLVFSSFSFFFTLVIGAVLFAFLAIEFPTIMRQLIDGGQQLPRYLSSLGLSDRYMIWVDILLTGDKLVLLGCVFVTRIIFAMIGGVFGPLFGGSRSGSQFEGWGR